jgi:hypothetical protein
VDAAESPPVHPRRCRASAFSAWFRRRHAFDQMAVPTFATYCLAVVPGQLHSPLAEAHSPSHLNRTTDGSHRSDASGAPARVSTFIPAIAAPPIAAPTSRIYLPELAATQLGTSILLIEGVWRAGSCLNSNVWSRLGAVCQPPGVSCAPYRHLGGFVGLRHHSSPARRDRSSADGGCWERASDMRLRVCVKAGFKFPGFRRSQIPHLTTAGTESPVSNSPVEPLSRAAWRSAP